MESSNKSGDRKTYRRLGIGSEKESERVIRE